MATLGFEGTLKHTTKHLDIPLSLLYAFSFFSILFAQCFLHILLLFYFFNLGLLCINSQILSFFMFYWQLHGTFFSSIAIFFRNLKCLISHFFPHLGFLDTFWMGWRFVIAFHSLALCFSCVLLIQLDANTKNFLCGGLVLEWASITDSDGSQCWLSVPFGPQ